MTDHPLDMLLKLILHLTLACNGLIASKGKLKRLYQSHRERVREREMNIHSKVVPLYLICRYNWLEGPICNQNCIMLKLLIGTIKASP